MGLGVSLIFAAEPVAALSSAAAVGDANGTDIPSIAVVRGSLSRRWVLRFIDRSEHVTLRSAPKIRTEFVDVLKRHGFSG